MSQKIQDIKEQISELKEYLNSDICKNCEEIANKLEQYIQELKAILNQDDTNS